MSYDELFLRLCYNTSIFFLFCTPLFSKKGNNIQLSILLVLLSLSKLSVGMTKISSLKIFLPVYLHSVLPFVYGGGINFIFDLTIKDTGQTKGCQFPSIVKVRTNNSSCQSWNSGLSMKKNYFYTRLKSKSKATTRPA